MDVKASFGLFFGMGAKNFERNKEAATEKWHMIAVDFGKTR